MKDAEAFIKLCKQAIADVQAGLVDFHVAAEEIYKQANKHPCSQAMHPMLYEVRDLVYNIVQDCRTEADSIEDWNIITKTIHDYTEGDWVSTCWILNGMYGKFTGKKAALSYGVMVRRQNGTTIIEAASKNMKDAIGVIAERLNPNQTDQRYLQNLVKCMPENIGIYKLVNVELEEYVTQPYIGSE